jgi:hypothetical protein
MLPLDRAAIVREMDDRAHLAAWLNLLGPTVAVVVPLAVLLLMVALFGDGDPS